MKKSNTLIVWGILVVVVLMILLMREQDEPLMVPLLSQQEALSLIESGEVTSYDIQNGTISLTVDDAGDFPVIPDANAAVSQELADAEIPYVATAPSQDFQQPDEPDNSSFWLYLLLPIIAIVAIIYFLRKFGGGGNSMSTVIELRKTKAREIGDADKAKFTDVGGNLDAVEMLEDVVDFLKNPQRWKSVNARLPRGILLVGPPGTGKTLLARAVAGETNSAFFYTSAAEFVEMFVGVGAARVRDTFEMAAKEQPAIVFIDEIDAIGRRRGSAVGTMHEEREQTLNQLLVLMDGLEKHDRLVVMAATNRPDVLDPALMRSGRFDRMLKLDAPKEAERVEILKVHARDKPLSLDVSLERLAALTDGFTGADLETLINDATLAAVRRNREDQQSTVEMSMADFELALQNMKSANRQFDRLDSILVESVTQFAEPTGRAVVRASLISGAVFEGDVAWMNAMHVKLRQADGTEVVLAKETIEHLTAIDGTEMTARNDFVPDQWAAKTIDAG